MMLGMDGLKVSRAVRQQTGMPYVHMILRTSRQSKEDIIAGLESGADDYLTKPYDAVSRYGGEEFLVVLNGCRTTQGANRAEHMRHAIYDHAVETASQAVAISMSFGVAGTEDWQELNAEQLIHEADVALYRAKSLGRNRTVLARPSGLQ